MLWKVSLVLLFLGSVLALPTLEGEDLEEMEDLDYDFMKSNTTDGDAEETSMHYHENDYDWVYDSLVKNDTTDGDAGETSMYAPENGSGSDNDYYDEDYHEEKVDGDASETQFRPVFRAPQPDSPRRRVAFSVRKATGRRFAETTLRFQDVLTNTGRGWQGNRFIVPRSGTYFFTFHAVGGRTSDFSLSLMRGRRSQVTAFGTQESFEHGSNSVVLRLSRGEPISLRLTQGRIYEHPEDEAYTTFSGFLL